MALLTKKYDVDDMHLRRDPRSEVRATRTVHFTVDGADYEIDLDDKNTRGFFKAIRPYQEAGRRVNRHRRPRSAADREESRRIREWARSRGYEVSDYGRIAGPIVTEYREANGSA